MKNLAILPILVFFISQQSNFSQELEPNLELTSKDSIIERSWHVGIGFNAVDDSGDMFDELFAVDSQWNYVYYPSRVNLGRYFKSGIGIDAIATYNKYQEGKLIEGSINTVEKDYYAVDSRVTYDLMKIFKKDSWFDPYVGVGLGYAKADNVGRGTYNAVIGFRTWISEKFGIDFNATGKWRISNDNATNHLQHGVGVVYRFGIEKGLNESGEEKLALMEALEKEKQRQLDSLNQVEKEKELARKLEMERAFAQQQAEEEAKKAARENLLKEIESQIAELGNAYFDLNSSYLNKNAKTVLKGLAEMMEKYPQLELEISSHADSRGSETYNQWLSERRVNRTLEYLMEQGVSEARLHGESFGETQLLNNCDDHTYCPEDKHKVNRRSEFKIVKY
ncbi:OmpA family protein [Cytophaga sp. FL35]|uniref:OmpA family protein n=1 Tax=Cytophaga sp. FL35 TaxID=1904456 RepID=UPI001653B5A0|nr:OmpA family protein [Cytophaga sp. FL35]MBC6997972.1 OmpA family protein [Cytophaga sp. FL35]